MQHLIEVCADCFNVVRRLKNIDKNYVVCFNAKNMRYEVRYRMGLNLDYLAAVPGNALTARVVNHILSTRVENFEQIIRELEN